MDRILNFRFVLASTILGCALFGTSESVTQMSPPHQGVPEGGSFKLTCISRRVATNGTLFRNELYKVGESGRVSVSRNEVEAGETKHTNFGGRASITTVFRVEATQASAGTYGCMPIPVNGSLPHTLTQKDMNREVTVHICSEPHLELSQKTGDDPIQIQGVENCNYRGELTWLVNGRQATRNPAAEDAASPAIQNDDDTLEIYGSECGEAESNACTVTAVFTYITADSRRISSVRETLTVSACCLPSYISPSPQEETSEETASEVNTPGILPIQPLGVPTVRPKLDSDRMALEKEVLELEKDVLKYKLTALPLQIKFLKRLNRDHATGREMEKYADDI